MSQVDNKSQLVLNEFANREKEKPDQPFERGELKTFLDYISKKHNIAPLTVRNVYYRKIKPQMVAAEKELQAPAAVAKMKQSITSASAPVHVPASQAYSPGDIIKVRVTSVMAVGLQLRLLDNPTVKGFLHIGSIKHGYISNIYDLFRAGDIFKARVKSIPADDKVEVSTLNMDVEADVRRSRQVIKTYMQKRDPAEADKPISFEAAEAFQEAEQADQYSDAIKFVRGIVGALSPKAVDRLKRLVDEEGSLKFTLSMVEVAKNFENDLGLKFLEDLERSLSKGVPTVTYKSKEHSEKRYIERVELCTYAEARERLLRRVSQGMVVIEVGKVRYIRDRDLFFPCVQVAPNVFHVVTVLTWEMVEHRLQETIDKYIALEQEKEAQVRAY